MRAHKTKRCEHGTARPVDVVVSDGELIHFSIDKDGKIIELWLKLGESPDWHVPSWTDYTYQQIGLDGKPMEVFSNGQPYCPPHDKLHITQWPVIQAKFMRWQNLSE